MIFFDRELWVYRAKKRHLKSRSKENSSHKKTNLVKDLEAIDKLEVLVAWCTGRKIEVVFARRSNGYYSPDERRAYISGRLCPENQLYFLLHECGHFLIGTGADPQARFGMGYPQTDATIKRSFHHKLDIFDEEMEAWWRGLKLATKLEITVNRGSFDKERLQALHSYANWMVGKGDFEIEDDA